MILNRFVLSFFACSFALTSCLKDDLTAPSLSEQGISPIRISAVLAKPSGNALCKQRTAQVTVTGTRNFAFFTTGTPNDFYKQQIPCSEFQFRVERVNSVLDSRGSTVGSVSDRCELQLDETVTESSGQIFKIFASPKSNPQDIEDATIYCIEPSAPPQGSTPTPTPTPVDVDVSAVYLKNSSAQELCSDRTAKLVIEGYKNNVFYSTEWGFHSQWDCSDFDFTVNKVNWAGAVMQFSIGTVDSFCNLRLWFSHDDGYVQVRAKYKDASNAQGVGQWKCE